MSSRYPSEITIHHASWPSLVIEFADGSIAKREASCPPPEKTGLPKRNWIIYGLDGYPWPLAPELADCDAKAFAMLQENMAPHIRMIEAFEQVMIEYAKTSGLPR